MPGRVAGQEPHGAGIGATWPLLLMQAAGSGATSRFRAPKYTTPIGVPTISPYVPPNGLPSDEQCHAHVLAAGAALHHFCGVACDDKHACLLLPTPALLAMPKLDADGHCAVGGHEKTNKRLATCHRP